MIIEVKNDTMLGASIEKACLVKLQKENQKLKKQLDYLRSGEYLNQLKFERNMLQDVVDTMEVAPEDKAFIDCTHRNTELLAQQKEFIEWLEEMIKSLFKEEKYEIGATYGYILSKYKEIIGGDRK